MKGHVPVFASVRVFWLWVCVQSFISCTCQSCAVSTGLAVLIGLVYAVGGFNGSLRVRSIDVYDPVSDTWNSCPSMEARRSTLGVAVLNGLIFAVGGFDGSTGKGFVCLLACLLLFLLLCI